MTQTRTLTRKQPKFYRDPNPANRTGVFTMGPLRYGTGRSKGQIVHVDDYEARRLFLGLKAFNPPMREVVCHRCGIGSHKGLPPMHKVATFDPESGDGIKVLMHRACPANSEKVKRFLRQRAKLDAALRAQELGVFTLRDGKRLRAKQYDEKHNADR
jgi:hypothetical protein